MSIMGECVLINLTIVFYDRLVKHDQQGLTMINHGYLWLTIVTHEHQPWPYFINYSRP